MRNDSDITWRNFCVSAPKFTWVDWIRAAVTWSVITSAPVAGSYITFPLLVRVAMELTFKMPNRFTWKLTPVVRTASQTLCTQEMPGKEDACSELRSPRSACSRAWRDSTVKAARSISYKKAALPDCVAESSMESASSSLRCTAALTAARMAAIWLSDSLAWANSFRSAAGSALILPTMAENKSVDPKAALTPSLTVAPTEISEDCSRYQPRRTLPVSSLWAQIW